MPSSATPYELTTLSDVLRRIDDSARSNIGGFILSNGEKADAHLSMEFMLSDPSKGVRVDFVEAPTLERAKAFLMGETYFVSLVSHKLFLAFKLHLKKTSRPKRGYIDVKSGCPLLEGYVKPL